MSNVTPFPSKGQKCPVCKQPTRHAFRPFCSKRCADVDLFRWLGGKYAIPGHQDAEEDGEPGAAESEGAGGAEDEKQ
jgi:hypothetical protein